MLNRALELHRAGRLDDAAALYQRLLTDNPGHADAAHLVGLLFDSVRFTRGLEAAYRRMWARFAEGNAPEAFDVRED